MEVLLFTDVRGCQLPTLKCVIASTSTYGQQIFVCGRGVCLCCGCLCSISTTVSWYIMCVHCCRPSASQECKPECVRHRLPCSSCYSWA